MGRCRRHPSGQGNADVFEGALRNGATGEHDVERPLQPEPPRRAAIWVLCGTPARVADTLEEWFLAGAADGYNILPPYFPGAFDDFVDLVVPELQRRGLFRRDYEGMTLRDHFGLKRVAV